MASLFALKSAKGTFRAVRTHKASRPITVPRNLLRGVATLAVKVDKASIMEELRNIIGVAWDADADDPLVQLTPETKTTDLGENDEDIAKIFNIVSETWDVNWNDAGDDLVAVAEKLSTVQLIVDFIADQESKSFG